MPIPCAAAASFALALLAGSQASAGEGPSDPAQKARDATLKCAGQLAFGPGASSLSAGANLSFEVSVAFGEGEMLALVDPVSSKPDRVIYDAESTSGSLRFGDGAETAIVWTRMSGSAGPLIGEAVMSNGDVVTLSIERAPPGSAERPFVLFSIAGASAYRGACSP